VSRNVIVADSPASSFVRDPTQDETLHDWVADELRDTLDIERHLAKTLARMAKAAAAAEARQAVASHLESARERIGLLRGILSDLNCVPVDPAYVSATLW